MTAIHELVVPRSIPRILDIFEKIVLLFPYPLSRRRTREMRFDVFYYTIAIYKNQGHPNRTRIAPQ
jgi:hypothetical protein